jgi:hypothetical protein
MGKVRDSYETVLKYRDGIGTLVTALAALVTTWCAYQGSIWGRVQSLQAASAAAKRVESTRAELASLQLAQVDIQTFLAWAGAVYAEQGERGLTPPAEGPGYAPDPSRLSGFLYQRFRPEFRPAIHAWVASRPLVNRDAAPTPFALSEYERPLAKRAEELAIQADDEARTMSEAAAIASKYMMTTVLTALAVFFARPTFGVGRPRNALILLSLAVLVMIFSIVMVFRLPLGR